MNNLGDLLKARMGPMSYALAYDGTKELFYCPVIKPFDLGRIHFQAFTHKAYYTQGHSLERTSKPATPIVKHPGKTARDKSKAIIKGTQYGGR